MSIGSNIKKRRFELRMSQQELADALGYKTRSTIAKIELDENEITISKLRKFAEVLDTTVEELSGMTIRDTFSTKSTELTSASIKKENNTIAVILAGGKSSRNQQNIPNQFINILGKPVIIYTLEAYQNHPAIDDIYIVCLKGWENIVKAYAQQYGIAKIKGIIPGATTGILSVKNAIDELKSKYKDNDIIVFQESTRPLITVEMISKLLQETYEKGSANISRKTIDHLQFIVDENEISCVNREKCVEIESPEAYKLSYISSIFDEAKKLNHSLNESCCGMLIYNLGYRINFIEDNGNNLKIIRQEDIAIFKALIS